MPTSPTDLTDQRFGRVTVLRLDPVRAPDRQARWHCRCDCGKEWVVKAGSLRNGGTRSCGCPPPNGSKHPLYRRWHNMIGRCTRPHHPDYENYGKRGIRVCERWLTFQNFIADMEPSFEPGLFLDRINNDRGYEPDNVRWTTMTGNIRNRRTSVTIETPWGPMSPAEAAERVGVSYQIFDSRWRKGWPAERLFALPSGPSNKAKDSIRPPSRGRGA